ncbi:MAG: hypothetical protein LBU32_22740 [Clostridiales bacterium]|nr:hypothetical protein [Clostridiales bacterium]
MRYSLASTASLLKESLSHSSVWLHFTNLSADAISSLPMAFGISMPGFQMKLSRVSSARNPTCLIIRDIL